MIDGGFGGEARTSGVPARPEATSTPSAIIASLQSAPRRQRRARNTAVPRLTWRARGLHDLPRRSLPAATEQIDWNIANVGQILSFGEDAQNELYMLASSGRVYRNVRQ
jgi:hypothetical protein